MIYYIKNFYFSSIDWTVFQHTFENMTENMTDFKVGKLFHSCSLPLFLIVFNRCVWFSQDVA